MLTSKNEGMEWDEKTLIPTHVPREASYIVEQYLMTSLQIEN